MPDFWRVSLKAVAGTQEIINVLYYVDDATGDATFDTAAMGDLANALDPLWDSEVAQYLINDYVGQTIEVVLVNDLNETISPFSVEVPATFAGAGISLTATYALSMVVGFRVGPMAEGQLAFTPKRSYIAVGPLAEDIVGDNGLLGFTQPVKEDIEAMVSQNIVGGLGTYRPVRVGRGRSDLQPSYGEVVDAIVRPYATFRRSRLIRPSGN